MQNWNHTNWLKDGDPDPYEGKATVDLKKSALMALGKALDGLTADTPEDYLAHVASSGTTSKALRHGMLTMSGCALTALGLWRHLGVGDKVLWDSYKIGKAVADVVTVAKAHKTWKDLEDVMAFCFRLGDVVLVASPEHVFTVVSEPRILELRDGKNGRDVEKFSFDALHGGRVTKGGKQLIEISETIATWMGGRLVITGISPATNIATKPRSVRGFARTLDMELTRDAFLPEGWNND